MARRVSTAKAPKRRVSRRASQPAGPASKAPSKEICQSINVLNLTGIAHVSPVRTLRQFMTQVRHGDVRAVLLKQAVNPVLPSPAALVAHELSIGIQSGPQICIQKG